MVSDTNTVYPMHATKPSLCLRYWPQDTQSAHGHKGRLEEIGDLRNGDQKVVIGTHLASDIDIRVGNTNSHFNFLESLEFMNLELLVCIESSGHSFSSVMRDRPNYTLVQLRRRKS